MAFVYILHSSSLGSYYVGSTQTSVEERLEKHLSGHYGPAKHTHKAKDWVVFYQLKCENIAQAAAIERHIKSMKSKTYIENLKKHPEIGAKLLLTYAAPGP